MLGQPQRVHDLLGLHCLRVTPDAQVDRSSLPAGEGKRRSELQGLTVTQCVTWDLKGQVSEMLKLSRDQISIDAHLADFGVDSVSLAELARRLTRLYRCDVLPSVFFSYPTLAQV